MGTAASHQEPRYGPGGAPSASISPLLAGCGPLPAPWTISLPQLPSTIHGWSANHRVVSASLSPLWPCPCIFSYRYLFHQHHHHHRLECLSLRSGADLPGSPQPSVRIHIHNGMTSLQYEQFVTAATPSNSPPSSRSLPVTSHTSTPPLLSRPPLPVSLFLYTEGSRFWHLGSSLSPIARRMAAQGKIDTSHR